MEEVKCSRPQIRFDSYEGEMASHSPWVTEPKNIGNLSEGIYEGFSQT